MACATCGNKKGEANAAITTAQNINPFHAADIQVVLNGEIRRFQPDDWDNDKTKLLILIPEAFTPVCETELGAMSSWYNKFLEHNCELIAVCTDPPHMMLDWQNSEPLLKDPPYKTFSSYLLPQALGLVEAGRSKRASVFVTPEGEVIRQELFPKVGRSFAELHRTVYAYSTGSYCGEGWEDPSDALSPPV